MKWNKNLKKKKHLNTVRDFDFDCNQDNVKKICFFYSFIYVQTQEAQAHAYVNMCNGWDVSICMAINSRTLNLKKD